MDPETLNELLELFKTRRVPSYPGIEKDCQLLGAVYVLLLHLLAMTRQGRPWYDPQSQGFCDRVQMIMDEYEDVFGASMEKLWGESSSGV